MKNVTGIILNVEGENSDLKKLLQARSVSTLPFAGRYRLIDFALSNLVNSGVKKIGVIGSCKYSSLIDHLGTGSEWSLCRKSQDLSILAGSNSVRFGGLVKINLRDLQANIPYLLHDKHEDLLITAPNLVTNIDYHAAYNIHKKNNADVTLLFRKTQPNCSFTHNDVFVDFNQYRITDINYLDDSNGNYIYADSLIIKKSVLLDLIKIGHNSGEWDLMDLLKENVNKLRIYGSPHPGYYSRILNLNRFLQTSIDLLNYDIMKELFMQKSPIYTKIKDNHPCFFDDNATVHNSIVGSGGSINGKIDQSILFREAFVGENTQIKHSIIMQKCIIGDNVQLDYVIMDKNVHIRNNTKLTGTANNPIVLSKGSTI